MKHVGDNLAFVLPAYIFVFGIWSATSSYDYISAKWQTVGEARRRGMRHLCVLILPMLYMLICIKFQADADDAKEVAPELSRFFLHALSSSAPRSDCGNCTCFATGPPRAFAVLSPLAMLQEKTWTKKAVITVMKEMEIAATGNSRPKLESVAAIQETGSRSPTGSLSTT